MTDFLAANPQFADLAAQAAGLGSVERYASSLFALLAVPVGAFAAVRLGTFTAAETDRRLTVLAVQPQTRGRLLNAESAATLAGAVMLTTVAGAATWPAPPPPSPPSAPACRSARPWPGCGHAAGHPALPRRRGRRVRMAAPLDRCGRHAAGAGGLLRRSSPTTSGSVPYSLDRRTRNDRPAMLVWTIWRSVWLSNTVAGTGAQRHRSSPCSGCRSRCPAGRRPRPSR
jgi:hypothetical protein